MKDFSGIKKQGERLQASSLCSELSRYKEAGVPVTVEGYKVDIDEDFANMLLREGPCTYMRTYSFNEEGKVTAVEFGRVTLTEFNN